MRDASRLLAGYTYEGGALGLLECEDGGSTHAAAIGATRISRPLGAMTIVAGCDVKTWSDKTEQAEHNPASCVKWPR